MTWGVLTCAHCGRIGVRGFEKSKRRGWVCANVGACLDRQPPGVAIDQADCTGGFPNVSPTGDGTNRKGK